MREFDALAVKLLVAPAQGPGGARPRGPVPPTWVLPGVAAPWREARSPGRPGRPLHHSRTSKWTPSRLSSQLCWASSAVPCSRSAVGLSSLGPGVSEPPTLDHSGSCSSGGRAALGKCREHPPRDVLLPFNPLTTEEGRRVAWNPKQAGELAVPRGCGE